MRGKKREIQNKAHNIFFERLKISKAVLDHA